MSWSLRWSSAFAMAANKSGLIVLAASGGEVSALDLGLEHPSIHMMHPNTTIAPSTTCRNAASSPRTRTRNTLLHANEVRSENLGAKGAGIGPASPGRALTRPLNVSAEQNSSHGERMQITFWGV